MAMNTGDGFRRGSVLDRAQFQAANGDYLKRNTTNGQIMARKKDGTPFKGVAMEQDGRKNRYSHSVKLLRCGLSDDHYCDWREGHG